MNTDPLAMKSRSYSQTCAARGIPLALAALLLTLPAFGQTVPQPAPVWRAREEVKPFTKAAPPKPQPASVVENLTPTEVVRLEAPDLTTLLAEDAAAQGSAQKPQRIGIKRSLPTPIESDKSANGIPGWQQLKSGQQLRVFTLESAEAVAIRIHFEKLALPAGATLLVFNADNPAEVCGPYDAAFAGGRDEFWSESVFGSRVTVECLLPAGVETARVRFQVREIIHGYVPLEKLAKRPAGIAPKAAGACNNDVTCSPDWIQTSHAVAGLGTIGQAGELWCTGCLVADTDTNTFIDYFLTANHCVGSQAEANTLEFYWFYQTSTCDGAAPNPATVPRTSGGADYLAGATADAGNDFTFLQLRQDAPANVTYAGWSSTPLVNAQSVIVVHHPQGDFKRISFGNQVGSDSDLWEILWNDGTTEPGSSGSPLFNANHEIVGQLYGGGAACTNMTATDFFGRFDVTFPQVQGWLLGLPPDNDHFANALTLTGPSGVVRGSSVGATKEPGEPDHAGNAGGHSVWYRWTAPLTGQVRFATLGSGFDTTLAVYTGGSVSALTEIASNNDSVGTNSVVTFAATAGTTYSIAVDGYNGAYGLVNLSWFPWNDRFADAFVLTGAVGSVSGLNVGATKEPGEPSHAGNAGGHSIWYRWTAPATRRFRFDTLGSDFNTLLAVYIGSSVNGLTAIASNDNATSTTTSSAVAFNATAGTTYSIVVDGNGGATGTFYLSWYNWNDNFADALVLNGSTGDVSGSNVGATREASEPTHPDNAGGASVWYRWTAPASGTVTFDTEASGIDSLLAVYTGAAFGSLTLIDSNDDLDFAGGIYTSRVIFNATAGTTYRIAVDGYRDTTTPGSVASQGFVLLTWNQPGSPGSPPANNDFAAAQVLDGVSGTVPGSNRLATKETGEPNHAGTTGGQSIWYRWTASADGQATLDTIGSDFDTVLAVYTGGAVNSLTAVASNDDASNASRASQVSFAAAAGTTYRIAVDGYRTQSGTVREGALGLNWSQAVPPTPPDLSDPQVLANGQFRLTVNGVVGRVYAIESSSTLSGWTQLGTVTNTSAASTFTDTTAAGQSQRFYRAWTVSP